MKRIILLFATTLALPLATHAAEMDLTTQIMQGGIPLIAIGLLSLLSVTVIIERLIHLRAKAVIPAGLAQRAEALWEAREFDALGAAVEDDNSTLSHLIGYLLTQRHHSFAIVSSGAGDIASTELRAHQQKFYSLSIVATVAPIVGLLGTVLGMIESFRMIAYADGMGNPALLAGGISQALINTAAGLCVALPALVMHHYFKNRIANLGLELERQVNRLINQWFLNEAEKIQLVQAVAHAH